MSDSFLGGAERLYATPDEDDDYEPRERIRLVDDPVRLVDPPNRQAPVKAKPVAKERRKIDVRGSISTGLELAGIGAVSTGGFLVAPWLGCMLLGVLLVLLGVAVGYAT